MLFNDDCVRALSLMDENSIDAIVTDPPYGLSKTPDIEQVVRAWLAGEEYHNGKGFMSQEWDSFVPSPRIWKEALRVLKPGGHIIAFAGARTQDLMGLSLRMAGFEIRDCVYWIYSGGFPKSLDISKAIDKHLGTFDQREVVAQQDRLNAPSGNDAAGRDSLPVTRNITLPASEQAKEWDGWGTALRPSVEPCILARKPLSESTVAANVLEHDTGGLNINACRIPTGETWTRRGHVSPNVHPGYGDGMFNIKNDSASHEDGRWPANAILDGSEEVIGEFDHAGVSTSKVVAKARRPGTIDGSGLGLHSSTNFYRYDDSGTAARYFMHIPFDEEDEQWTLPLAPEHARSFYFCPKAQKGEREAGLDGHATHPPQSVDALRNGGREADGGATEEAFPAQDSALNFGGVLGGNGKPINIGPRRNVHPTVKPIKLMRYLCRLVVPVGGVVLDPFMGSGTTGAAARLEGFSFVGVERDPQFFKIAEARIRHWEAKAK